MPQYINLSEMCKLTFVWQVFSPANVIFAGVGVLLSVCIFLISFVWAVNAYIPQAAKDARTIQDTLIEIFERIEMFFRRLEIYTEVPATKEMMEIIVQILVEVLSILGIATKKIKESRMSKYLP